MRLGGGELDMQRYSTQAMLFGLDETYGEGCLNAIFLLLVFDLDHWKHL